MTLFTVSEFATIPRYDTAIAQWLNCMVFILAFPRQRRLRGGKMGLLCALALAALCGELMFTSSWRGALWIAGMIGSAAIMMLFLYAALDLTPVQTGCILTAAFMWSELAASLDWQIYSYYAAYIAGEYRASAACIIILIVYAAAFFAAYRMNAVTRVNGRCRQVYRPMLFSSILISVALFTLSNLSFVFPDTPFTSSYATEIFNIRTLVDLGAIAALYSLFMQQQEMQTRYEMDTIRSLMQQQYVQYTQSRDSMELINRKYHDIKHQLAVVRAESDPERRSRWLDAIERDVAYYGDRFETGCAVLDTILTGRSMACRETGIQLTCVAEGALLVFMEEMDICSLFGNIVDNAMEAVLQCEDPEKRLIHVSVSREKGFVLIRAENYFEGTLCFEDGLPKSTKGDDNFHGFGMKSIRYTAGKYGGSVSVDAEDHWFDLKVLFPLP